LNIFADNPLLGIGPGAGTEKRVDYGYGDRVAAHIEYSRLLAEHGLFGVFSLLILVFTRSGSFLGDDRSFSVLYFFGV